MAVKIICGILFGYFAALITDWYYNTQNKRKMQIGTSLISGLYGLLFIFYLFSAGCYFENDMVWGLYGLGGLVTWPLLFG